MRTVKKLALTLLAVFTLACGVAGITTAKTQKAYADGVLNANLNIGKDIALKLSAKIDGATSASATFSWKGNEADGTEKAENYVDTVVGENSGDGTFVFTYRGIGAQYLGKNVDVTVKYKTESETEAVYAQKTLSVKDILTAYRNSSAIALGISPAAFEKIKTLSADILNYGAAAQEYTKVDTSALVNKDLAESDYTTVDFTNLTGEVNQTGDLKFVMGVRFDCNIQPMAKFTSNKQNLTAKINDKEAALEALGENQYKITYKDFNILSVNDTYRFEVFENETSIGSATCSLAALAKKYEVEILRKAYTYGTAVSNYLSWCDYHVCRNVCQTCNKCTDLNCMDDTCFEKCACDGVVKSVFYSLSDYVESEHFVRNDKGFLGAVTNGKAYAVFKVNATTATTATLKMLVSTQMADGTTFNESMLLYVNGTQQTCTVQMPTGGTWTTFETVTLGDYQLVAGTNTIRIEMHATEPGTKTCNIKAIRLDCDQQILWDGYVNHACMSTCPVCSGCKDAECQDPACAIKCICIKSTLDVMDVDAEIIIESGELNPAKGQIGGTSSNTLLTFKVMVDKAGDYAIFANIGSFGSKTVASRLAITANGTALTMSTDSYGLGYEVYQDVYLATATLVEGENVIVWDYLDDAINFRSMTLIGVGNVQWNHSCASACSVCGGCGDENCTSQICATKCKCIFSTLSVTATGTTVGFVGDGSLNYSAGRTGGTAKGTVVLVNVWADKADNTLLTIPVSQGSGSAVNSLDAFSVKVNGVNHSIPADCNVSVVSDWSAWTDVSFGVLALEEGLNTIEFTLLNTGFNFQKFVFNAIGGAKITYPTSNMMVSADDANYAITGSGSYDATNLRIEQTNTGTQVAFNVTSDKQGQVDLYLIIGKAVNNVAFGSCLAVDVNGVEFDTTGVAFSSGADAYTWIKVGTISLNEGANTITFENLDGYVNYYGISLVGAGVNVSWTAK